MDPESEVAQVAVQLLQACQHGHEGAASSALDKLAGDPMELPECHWQQQVMRTRQGEPGDCEGGQKPDDREGDRPGGSSEAGTPVVPSHSEMLRCGVGG